MVSLLSTVLVLIHYGEFSYFTILTQLMKLNRPYYSFIWSVNGCDLGTKRLISLLLTEAAGT